tara:strand:- start:262 stop:867 length:606 start_codon:yes stop_codon:yes gene_type:complete
VATIVLVRHGQSEWNNLNLFTGWKNPDLTKKGIQEAKDAGRFLRKRKIEFNTAFTSDLIRAQHTLRLILGEIGQTNINIKHNISLNERNYGDLAGLNKDDARKKWGEEQVHIWRRSYDISPPGGESLKDTADRVLPYYKETIAPEIEEGSNVLIVAHGNSLRALVMFLEKINPEDIVNLEIRTGIPLIFKYKGIDNIKRIY